MPAPQRRNPAPRRRRRDDEDGEDSIAGEGDDYSLSEGSVISNVEDEADAEGSDASGEEDDVSVVATHPEPQLQTTEGPGQSHRSKKNGRPIFGFFVSTPDTEAMMNGLKAKDAVGEDDLQYEDVIVESGLADGSKVEEQTAVPATAHTETPAQRSRREHLEYIKQKNSDPAFVPNRGGFFLHDDRGSNQAPPSGRYLQRGRGRGFGAGYGTGRGFGPAMPEVADRPWAHDLHDTVNKSVSISAPRPAPASTQIPTAKPASTPPNRSFSVSTVLGNVSVQIYLPGMDGKKTVPNIAKKQHTLLPQHRPPLRRDKPVRISLPDEHPRYIFPSTERSFIFIPRALRPNQQSYTRGRGRGSFQGSRRPSLFGGSVYSPSIGMSRKSSISMGTGPNALQTPTTASFVGMNLPPNMNRPIVRMPVAGYPVTYNQHQPQVLNPYMVDGPLIQESGTPGPAILHSPTVAIPMHQPRPQKTVSVAEIESPSLNPPQQQQEQPFHQQMPLGVGLNEIQNTTSIQTQPETATGTPLSHIPEGAVYAQPFQPYPMYSQPGFYGAPYTNGHMFYPASTEALNYGMVMGGPVMAPQFGAGPRLGSFAQATTAGDNTGPQSTVAHESNGMVFYYDQSQFSSDGAQQQYQITPAGGLIGMPATPYIYPPMHNGVYYPPPSG